MHCIIWKIMWRLSVFSFVCKYLGTRALVTTVSPFTYCTKIILWKGVDKNKLLSQYSTGLVLFDKINNKLNHQAYLYDGSTSPFKKNRMLPFDLDPSAYLNGRNYPEYMYMSYDVDKQTWSRTPRKDKIVITIIFPILIKINLE